MSRVKLLLLIQQDYKNLRRREAQHARAFPKKKTITVPKPYKTRSITGNNLKDCGIKGLGGWHDEMNTVLTQLALRTLNDFAALETRDPHRKLTFEELTTMVELKTSSHMYVWDLTDVLFQACVEAGYGGLGDTAAGGPAAYQGEAIYARCEAQARFAMEVWESDFIPKRRAWGKKGGTASKTPFQYGIELLDDILDLTRKQQLVELADTGISQAALYRLRDRHPYYKKTKNIEGTS
ncbi:hypothetical protein [Clavibacter michiganensis]|nr:hypothetical protein [Clavibacter michiganensis]